MELWKPVKDYEGLYEVSNLGRIRSLNYKGNGKSQILKFNWVDRYYQVTLVKNKIRSQRTVHSLVAESFLIKPEGKNITINHKNGRKLDNRANNLEYITQSENIKHSYRLGLQKVKNNKEILCIELNRTFKAAVYAAKWLIENENLQSNIDTIQRNIRQCANGKRHTAYKYHWKFI